MASEVEAFVVGFRVRGRVQGVGYRWWTQRAACALGVRGHVRNCSDGSVEVVVVGARYQVEELYSSLQTGPPASRVVEVERFTPVEAPILASFQIVR